MANPEHVKILKRGRAKFSYVCLAGVLLLFCTTIILAILYIGNRAMEPFNAKSLLRTPLSQGWDAYNRQDYATTLNQWRPLAEQGDAAAQYALGVLYAYGQGVPQDFVQAQMWFNLAASQGQKDVRGAREEISKEMTAEQTAKAQRLAREWKPTTTQK